LKYPRAIVSYKANNPPSNPGFGDGGGDGKKEGGREKKKLTFVNKEDCHSDSSDKVPA
jgi:hypothetical protein